jgi:hypothetical protein
MSLASFDKVYEAYHQLVDIENKLTTCRTHDEYHWQPIKLIQAYAFAIQAITNKSIVRTSEWPRQSGASTTALSLAVSSKGVIICQADARAAKYATRRILNAFSEIDHVDIRGVEWYHEKVMWATNFGHNFYGQQRPELVIVDSEAAYVKDREYTIAKLSKFGCGVLVLEGPKLTNFI